MIEIIREEEGSATTERHGLPKDIKQMGKPDVGDRIYVENVVYQFLHPYSNVEEKRAYVLLGSFENYGEQACVFIEAVIFLEEMMFEGELPLWNDSTWAYIYKKMRKEYENMAIVGWAMDIKGQLPNMTMRLEAMHQNHFGGAHQVLFLIDSLEREEAFYGNKNGRLYRREGFYVYYERKGVAAPVHDEPQIENKDMQASVSFAEEHIRDMAQAMPRGKYRGQIQEEDGRHSAYAKTVVLALIVCALGVSVYWNNEKMKSMEATLAQMNYKQTVAAEEGNSEVKVENVAGNVTKQEEGSVQQEESSAQQEAAAQTAAEDAPTEPQAGAVSETVQASSDTAETAQASSDTASQEADGTQTDTASSVSDTLAQASSTEMADTSAQTNAQALAAAQTYLKQGYYIVQRGDSLVGICRSIYQTTAMLDKLCEVNEIENENEIYAGQKLILPN